MVSSIFSTRFSSFTFIGKTTVRSPYAGGGLRAYEPRVSFHLDRPQTNRAADVNISWGPGHACTFSVNLLPPCCSLSTKTHHPGRHSHSHQTKEMTNMPPPLPPSLTHLPMIKSCMCRVPHAPTHITNTRRCTLPACSSHQ